MKSQISIKPLELLSIREEDRCPGLGLSLPDGMTRGARGEGNRKTPGDTTPASTFAAFFVGLLSAG